MQCTISQAVLAGSARPSVTCNSNDSCAPHTTHNNEPLPVSLAPLLVSPYLTMCIDDAGQLNALLNQRRACICPTPPLLSSHTIPRPLLQTSPFTVAYLTIHRLTLYSSYSTPCATSTPTPLCFFVFSIFFFFLIFRFY